MYRRITVAIALAALVAACADTTAPTAPTTGAPSLAQVATREKINENLDIAGMLFNPCNEEAIAYTGTVHRIGYIDHFATGTESKLHVTSDLTGTGVTTGLTYGIKNKEKEAVLESFDPLTNTTTYSQHYSVTSKGSTSNFDMKFAYTFTDPPGTVTVTQMDSRCN
ncbi:MAG TPA: hypothetical protein VHM30_11170 [Gemmatimonadaceae bacterium]|nr:hypothetical protein [Gemmatimonadaceae bacterium]